MKRRLGLIAVVTLAACGVAWALAFGRAGEVAGQAAPTSGLAVQLRYIGRDGATGMPATVDDHFIAASEEAIARYGKDERQAVPPPPEPGLRIASVALPALGVQGAVASFGLDRFGRLDVPQDNRTIGWNPAYAALPGTGSATFFAAHFEYRGIPGVFARLAASRPGDEVVVSLSDGSRHRYRVTSTADYALGTIDMGALLLGREGTESITLMTCSGPANEGEYAFRTVVLAERIVD